MIRQPSLILLCGLSLAVAACAPAATSPDPAAAPAGQAPAADYNQPLAKPEGPLGLPVNAGGKYAGAEWKLTRLDNGATLVQGQADAEGRFTPTLPPDFATVPAKLVAAGAGFAAGKVLMGGVVGGVLAANGAWLQSANVLSAGGAAVISAGGGAVISAGGGAVISANGGNVISAGGGALQGFGLLIPAGQRPLLQAGPNPNPPPVPGPNPPAPGSDLPINPGGLLAGLALGGSQSTFANLAPNAPAFTVAAAQMANDLLGQALNQDLQSVPNADNLVFQADQSGGGQLPPELGEVVARNNELIQQAVNSTDSASVLVGDHVGQPIQNFPPFSFNGVVVERTPPAELRAALPKLDLPPPSGPLLPNPPGPGPGPDANNPLPLPGNPPPGGPLPGAPLPGAPLPGAPLPGAPLPDAPAAGGGGGGGGGGFDPDADPVPFVPAPSPGVALQGPFLAPTRAGGSAANMLGFGLVGFQALPIPSLSLTKSRSLVLRHGNRPEHSLFVMASTATPGMGVAVWRAPILPQGNLGAFMPAGFAPADCVSGAFVGRGASANVVGISAASAQYHLATVDGAGNISFTSPGGAQLAVAVSAPAVGILGNSLVLAGGHNNFGDEVATIQRIPLVGDSPASGASSLDGAMAQTGSGGKLFESLAGHLVWPNPATIDGVDSLGTRLLVPQVVGGFTTVVGPDRMTGGTDAALLMAGNHRVVLLAGGPLVSSPQALALSDLSASVAFAPSPGLRYAFRRNHASLGAFGAFAYLVGGVQNNDPARGVGVVEAARLQP